MEITSDLQDVVSLMADERLPEDWGAQVKVKMCRHGFRMMLHVNNPSGNEKRGILRRGALEISNAKIRMLMDTLVNRLQ